MTPAEYKRTLDLTKADLLSNQARLGKILKEQEELEADNVNLRQIIVALSKKLGESFIEEDALGLTDAIRQAFKTNAGPLEPTGVRARLQDLGYDISKYGNFMASIHTVINRLVAGKEIKAQNIQPGNKAAYVWDAK